MSESPYIPISRLPSAQIKGCGVYAIMCIHNHKSYIGSSKNIASRLRRHVRELRGGNHHCIQLQRSWNKYGEEAFEWNLLSANETQADAVVYEQEFIDFSIANGAEFLLNSNFVANMPPQIQHTPESRKKRGDALRGSTRTPEQKKRISDAKKAAGISPKHLAHLNNLSSQRRFTLSESDAAIVRDERIAGITMEVLAKRFGTGPKALRRELYARFPELKGLSAGKWSKRHV